MTTTVNIQTSAGDIIVQLEPEKTPKTVANFLEYVEAGFYNDTIFHRVIDGFMIQGGGLTSDMETKPTRDSIENEAKTGLENTIGTISMARRPEPHSATSQFFINTADNKFLNFTAETDEGYGYCSFGKVIDGMDVVKQISMVNTVNRAGHHDVPEQDIKILSVNLVNANSTVE